MGLRIGLMWRAGIVAAAVGAIAILAAPAFTQSNEATFKIEPGSQNVQLTASEVTFTMKVEDAVNLAAWEFRFAFDPDVLTYTGVTPSGFLAQTGRSQSCPSPTIVTGVDIPEVGNGLTTIQYGCNTLSDLPGVNGDGDLAIVRFTPKAAGTTTLICNKLELTDAFANTPQSVVSTPCTGVIKVLSGDSGGDGTSGGDNNSGGNSNSGGNNNVEPTPTPNVRVLTPTAIPGAVLTPTLRLSDNSGVDPSAPGAPASGSATGGTSGAASGSGSSSGSDSGGRSGVLGGIQGVANAPVAGYGMARDAFFTLSLWAQLTLVAGLMLAGTGAVVRVRNKR
jgi:hypothetical protein